jgi:hypothetical protein
MNKPYVNDVPVKTYRELLSAIQQMNDEQLDSNITVQDPAEDEFHPAELRIMDGNEQDVLDDYHPVIYIPL